MRNKMRERKYITNLEIKNIKQDISLNPEKLNVLETRKKRYSHNTVEQSYQVKRKRVCNTKTVDDEPVTKQRKRRPNKFILY